VKDTFSLQQLINKDIVVKISAADVKLKLLKETDYEKREAGFCIHIVARD
jgi:hypothetical protein